MQKGITPQKTVISIFTTQNASSLAFIYVVASHECLGRAVAVGTWVVVVIVHGKSAKLRVY
jgi:hypothetical protein